MDQELEQLMDQELDLLVELPTKKRDELDTSSPQEWVIDSSDKAEPEPDHDQKSKRRRESVQSPRTWGD